MGSSSSSAKPDLSDNELAMMRERKLNYLVAKWYETVVSGPPPPTNDPNLLRYETNVEYYFTDNIFEHRRISSWVEIPIPMTYYDEAAVDRTIASALENTTQEETGEGYGTCVIQSFEGKYAGEACLFKLIVIAVSFNFSASEYKTSKDVTAFGYWIYFFRTPPPFRYNEQDVLEPINVEPFGYTVPPDVSIVGKRYMTVEELDKYNP